MLHALILAKVSDLKHAPLEQAKNLDGFMDGFYVFGRYDLVLYIKAPDFEQLQDLIRKINQTPGIQKTETLAETA